MKAGVLALQGDFREHARMLEAAGATPIEVRTAEQLAGVDCLVIPGGESTTMSKLARAYGLVEPVRERIANGMPMFGTCAGMIVLARRVQGGEPLFGVMDIGVQRNAYGRQVDSFEADVDVRGIDRRDPGRLHQGTEGCRVSDPASRSWPSTRALPSSCGKGACSWHHSIRSWSGKTACIGIC